MNIVDDRHDFRPAGTERWLEDGSDYVVHSLTKYICGHGDALGGAVIVRDRARLVELRQGSLVHQGPVQTLAAWLIARGLETLPSSIHTHEANARTVAELLSVHPRAGGSSGVRGEGDGAVVARQLAERRASSRMLSRWVTP